MTGDHATAPAPRCPIGMPVRRHAVGVLALVLGLGLGARPARSAGPDESDLSELAAAGSMPVVVEETAHQVRVTLRGLLAEIETVQRLRSVDGAAAEQVVEYQFELPTGAIVTQFRVGGTDAVVVPDQEVNGTATGHAPDPGLLRRLRVGPRAGAVGSWDRWGYLALVPPGGVEVRVLAVVPVRLEAGRAVIDLAPRRGRNLAERTGVVATAPGPGPKLRGPTLRGGTVGARAATQARFAATADGPLEASAEVLQASTLRSWMLTASFGQGPGRRAALVAAALAPTAPAPRRDPPSYRRVVFLLDRSRSMAAVEADAVAAVVEQLAGVLPPSVELDALAFDREASPLLPGWRGNSADTRHQLIAAWRARPLGNGTDLGAALAATAPRLLGATPTLVVVITDGRMAPLSDAGAARLGDVAEHVDVAAVVLAPPARLPIDQPAALETVLDRYGGRHDVVDSTRLLAGARVVEPPEPGAARWRRIVLDGRGSAPGVAAIPVPVADSLAAGDGAVITTVQADPPARRWRVSGRGGRDDREVRDAVAQVGTDRRVLALASDAVAAADPAAALTSARAIGAATGAASLVVLPTTRALDRARLQLVRRGGAYQRAVPAGYEPGYPRLSVAAATPGTSLDPDLVKQLIQLHLLARLRACYQRALPTAPRLAGVLTLELLLADGEVVTADSQGLSHPAFRACVELAAHQLDVPVVSDDSFIRVRYPINFTIAADKPQVVLGDADSAEPLDPSLLPSTVPIDDAATDQPLGGELPRAR
jgi:hypothetical protein